MVAFDAVVRVLGGVFNAAGMSPSIAARNAGARSVTTSTGSLRARIALVVGG